MNPLIVLCIFVNVWSSYAYSQGSGLVQPLVSPLPSPGAAAAPAAAAPAAAAPAPVPNPGAIPSGGGQIGGRGVEVAPSPGATPVLGIDSSATASQVNTAEMDKWIEEAVRKVPPIPQKVSFVVDIPKKGIPQFLLLDAKKFNQSGYFQTANAAAVAWDLKLNKKGLGDRDGFEVVKKLSKADLVIHSPKVGDWSVFLAKGDQKKPIARGSAPVGTKEEDLIVWLTQILGWDGVVLEQRGHQLLVGSTSKILAQPQLQALAVDGSSAKIALDQNERKGSGLLSLVYAKSGIGIFDIVFLGQGVKTIPVGTKLVIEKK